MDQSVWPPCDILSMAGTPCVAAHSITRSLFSGYTGPLYQLRREGDLSLLDVYGTTTGIANSSQHEEFCGVNYSYRSCTIHKIYDQSVFDNHLGLSPGGGADPNDCVGVDASLHYLSLEDEYGNEKEKVFGAKFLGGQGYRLDKTNGIATDDDPETIYAVFNGQVRQLPPSRSSHARK